MKSINENNDDWMTPRRLQYELEKHPKYKRYLAWKEEYPNVFEKFQGLSKQLIDRGRWFGMWLIANKLRWDYTFEYNTDFKISNDYTALITRELILDNPELKKYVRIKRMSWADDRCDGDEFKGDLFQ